MTYMTEIEIEWAGWLASWPPIGLLHSGKAYTYGQMPRNGSYDEI